MQLTRLQLFPCTSSLPFGALLVAIALVAVACGSGSQVANAVDRQLDDESVGRLSSLRATGVGAFDPDSYTGTLPRDAIVPVYEPSFVSPDEIELWPNELVMGVEINGESHAYPIGLMRIREMVNDEVGGVPILVSW